MDVHKPTVDAKINITNTNNKPKINPLIIGGAVVLVLIIIGIVFWLYYKKPAKPLQEETFGGGLGSQLYENATNPLAEKLPETNPFDTITNPFEQTNINPIKANYKNPF